MICSMIFHTAIPFIKFPSYIPLPVLYSPFNGIRHTNEAGDHIKISIISLIWNKATRVTLT